MRSEESSHLWSLAIVSKPLQRAVLTVLKTLQNASQLMRSIVSGSVGRFIAIPFAALLFSPVQLYAYVDPGTGSLAIQGILGFVFAGILLLKTYWRRLLGFVRNPFRVRTERYGDRR